jgi:monoamine oxidase
MACHPGTNASILGHDAVLTTDKVVVALPLGILKNENVVFEPALSSEKIAAINSLGIGVMNKVFLKFDQNFWYEDGYFFQYLKENHSNEIEFFSPAPTGTDNILVAVFAGQQARSIEQMEDAQLLNLVMDDLKGMFGEAIPQPVSWQKTSWHTNPFSLGAYPHIKPGSDLSACSIIAEPVGEKVYFAGDTTTKEYMATAHSAYISGLEAAHRLEG